MAVEAERPKPAPRRRYQRVRTALSLPAKAMYSFGIRSTKTLFLPDFLIIGAPKAGTTWLAENLDCHPQIFMGKRPGTSDPTEIRYFTQSFRLPLEYYSNLFAAGKDLLKGDKSPGYATLSSFRVRFIRSIMPSSRIVYFLRDPVERAWSHAVMNFVKIDRHRIEDVPESRLFNVFVRGKDHGCYSANLERWQRVFGEDAVHTRLYEEIATDPLGVLRGVCEHIGADTNVDWGRFPYSRVVNKGARPPMPEKFRSFLEELYRPEIDRLQGMLGGAISRWRTAASATRRAALTALSLVITLSDTLADFVVF